MGLTNPNRREVEITLKGKLYTIRELDLKAYGDAENYIRSNHIQIYRESAKDTDPKLREEIVSKMIRESYTPEELGAAMAAPSASEYVAYLSLRHNTGVTRESIAAIVDMGNISEVNSSIAALQSDGDQDDEDNSGNPPEKEQSIP